MVNATDLDMPGSQHSKIRYSLLSGQDLFSIHPQTGVISTTTNTLDREVSWVFIIWAEIQHQLEVRDFQIVLTCHVPALDPGFIQGDSSNQRHGRCS